MRLPNPLSILGRVLRAVLTPEIAPSAPNATTGRVPIWWTILVAAASAYGMAAFGADLCGNVPTIIP